MNNADQVVCNLISDYDETLRLLEGFDENAIALPDCKPASSILDLETANTAIAQLKRWLMEQHRATSLFGMSCDNKLPAILGSIEQTMFGEPLYNSIQERAAHLLYFCVKDHPFTDGNKRIATILFLLYLKQEEYEHQISPQFMATITLLIAESEPNNKEQVIRLVVNLLA